MQNGLRLEEAHVVPGPKVRVGNGTARIRVPGQLAAAEPSIELVREGEVIKAIEITCSCGQCVRLHCVY